MLSHSFHLCVDLILSPSLLFSTTSMKIEGESYVWLCDLMDYAVHGIIQARIVEWVVFAFSRGSSQPRDCTQVSHIAGRFVTSSATRKA